MQHPSVNQFIREIHIDAHAIQSAQIEQLLKLGFYDDNFTAAGGGLDKPANHFTWETCGSKDETRRLQRDVLNRVVHIVKGEPGFSGYIESEIIAPCSQVSYDRRVFTPTAKIPLSPLDLIQTCKNKVADLHMKVPLILLTKALEQEFARIGCYYVETHKENRIYTIQFLSHSDGKAFFTLLKEFFQGNGGVVELTYEVCDSFVRMPEHLCAPAVLKEQGWFQLATSDL